MINTLAAITMAACATVAPATAPTMIDLPVTGYVFEGTDGTMIGTDYECWSAVVPATQGGYAFRDFATDPATGLLAPITFCEGEERPYFIMALDAASAEDQGRDYVVTGQV